MNYPIWDLPVIGGGLLIGLVAILHVFISHFAIGGGLFLVLNERWARRAGDAGRLDHVRWHARVFALVTMVVGAISGAGIWWTIGLVHPAATSTLMHVFVWVWGIEWVLFVVEIAAAYIYYYGWDRLDARTHEAVGWIYVVAAWLSLVAVNGILTFMLTPGRWLHTGSLLDAFFNPTFLPSLALRTSVCVALAGLYALLAASGVAAPAARLRATNHAAGWVLAGVAPLPLLGVWYVAFVPPMSREMSMGGAPIVTLFAAATVVLTAAVVAVTWIGPYCRPHLSNALVAGIIVVTGLGVTGATEWVREAVRKPWVIYGYMYSNGILLQDAPALRARGALASARWARVERVTPGDQVRAGAELFRLECGACHTVDGVNGIRPLVKGWSHRYIDEQLEHLDEVRGFMPPLLGTAEERHALAMWLVALGTGPASRSPGMAAMPPAPPRATGAGGAP
jgi:mono/diheme cytochrome c family protein